MSEKNLVVLTGIFGMVLSLGLGFGLPYFFNLCNSQVLLYYRLGYQNIMQQFYQTQWSEQIKYQTMTSVRFLPVCMSFQRTQDLELSSNIMKQFCFSLFIWKEKVAAMGKRTKQKTISNMWNNNIAIFNQHVILQDSIKVKCFLPFW